MLKKYFLLLSILSWISTHSFAQLITDNQDIYQVDHELKSFYTIVESILIEALDITFFENRDFHLCEIVVE